MEIVEFILRDTAWLVGILVGITTLIKNIKDLKGDKNKTTFSRQEETSQITHEGNYFPSLYYNILMGLKQNH